MANKNIFRKSCLLIFGIALLAGCSPINPGTTTGAITASTSGDSSTSGTSSSTTSVVPPEDFPIVTFKTYDDKVLKSIQVKNGDDAKYDGFNPVRPASYDKNRGFTSYEFIGWDKSLKNVQHSMTVKAVYEETNYGLLEFGYYPNTPILDTNIVTAVYEEVEKISYIDFDWNKSSRQIIELNGKKYFYSENGEEFVYKGRIVPEGFQVFDIEPIEWEILKVEGNKVKVISKNIIEANKWDAFSEDVGFPIDYSSEGAIKEFLENSVLKNAFDNDWRVATQYVDNSPSQYGQTIDEPGCEDTEDKISMLSISEFQNYQVDGLVNGVAEITPYVLSRGLDTVTVAGTVTAKTMTRCSSSTTADCYVFDPANGKFEKADNLLTVGIRPVVELTLTNFKYGEYPQTVVNDQALVNELDKISTFDDLGYAHYNGDKYLKSTVAKAYVSLAGDIIPKGKETWYKVEPIEWLPVGNNNGNYVPCVPKFELDRFDRFTQLEELVPANSLPEEYPVTYAHQWLNNQFYERAFVNGDSRILDTYFVESELDYFEQELILGYDNILSSDIYSIKSKVGLPSFYDLQEYNVSYLSSNADKSYPVSPNDYAMSKGSTASQSRIFTRTYGKYFEGANPSVLGMLFDENGSFTLHTDMDENGGDALPLIRFSFFDSTVEYGEYPRDIVVDEDLIEALDSISEVDEKGYKVYQGKKYFKSNVKLDPDWCPFTGNQISCYETMWLDDGDPYQYFYGDELYFEVEPIKWRVLENDGVKMKLISDETIDSSIYSNAQNAWNYSSSTLRTFLNNDFASRAFKAANSLEYQMVDNSLASTLMDYNPYTCPNTYDRVTVLSMKEIMSTKYFDSNADRKAITSEYARANGANVGDLEDVCDEGTYGKSIFHHAEYWLRTAHNEYENCICCADYTGDCISYSYDYSYIYYSYCEANEYGKAVRPVITVKI